MVTLPNVPIGYRLAFFGPMCCGKTTCAKYLADNYGYKRVSLADKLKSIAFELYGVQGKDGDNRRLIQELGDSLRGFDDDVFTKYTLASIRQHSAYDKIVIDDLRLQREANLLRNNGFMLIKVICDESVREARVKTLYPTMPRDRQGHPTEQSWQAIPANSFVNSTTAADLTALDSLVAGID